MKFLKDIIAEENYKDLNKENFPGFISPMLATLTEDYFDHPEWIYERKLDGVRCLVNIRDEDVQLYSRNEKNISQTYPGLKKAIQKQKYPNLIADGEIVAFKGNSTSFSELQNRIQLKDSEKIKRSKVNVFLYLFDLLYYEDYNLEHLPLRSRKKILKKKINWESPIRYTQHRNEKGKEYFKIACQNDWEGLIAKNGTSKYTHSRSNNWLKFKCTKGQELVIGGFTEPEGERVGFGALLAGYYENNQLYYAGKVGTGFDNAFLKQWREKFNAIETENSPFKNFDKNEKAKIHWIEPKYVGEFGFTEWTRSNKLRHPRFLGIRDDKAPEKVVKEEVK